MILYLFFPILILHGVVESQTANMTEEKLSTVEGNQTFSMSTKYNSTMKPGNVTSSLYTDVEDELHNNQTSSLITEDQEDFQDMEMQFPLKHCNQYLLINYSKNLCIGNFHSEMQNISTENWCVMDNIIRPYNKMTFCLENVSHWFGCYYPNPDIQDLFIYVHSSYFQNCTKEEPLSDAPHGLVIALTLIPVSLIPVLIYLVVWKSEIQD